jgi:hypothetical protein
VVFLPSRTTGNVGRFRDMLIEFSGLLARKSSKRHLPLAYLFMPTPGSHPSAGDPSRPQSTCHASPGLRLRSTTCHASPAKTVAFAIASDAVQDRLQSQDQDCSPKTVALAPSSLHAMSRLQRCADAFAIAHHAVQDRSLGPDSEGVI